MVTTLITAALAGFVAGLLTGALVELRTGVFTREWRVQRFRKEMSDPPGRIEP